MEFRRNPWTAVRYINARARTRSEMVAPIISNEEVIGVFDLESDELDAYSEDDLEVLMLLASQVAIIIDKVMLHEQLIEKQRLEIAVWTELPPEFPLLEAVRPVFQDFGNALVHVSQLF